MSGRISAITLAIAKIFPRAPDGTRMAQGTGFVVEYKNGVYLVTNWHVASGLHAQRKKRLSSYPELPHYLDVVVFGISTANPLVDCERVESFGADSQFSIVRHQFRLDLPSDQNFWKNSTHPEFGDDVDVFVQPITDVLSKFGSQIMVNPLKIDFAFEQLDAIGVMHPVHIAGFPSTGAVSPNHYPIYKSASIASEPRVFSSIPFVLMDGKTKPGMSGAPIFANPNAMKPASLSSKLLLYAIYSGRDEDDRDLIRSELAMAWPVRECLLPILENFASKAERRSS